MKIKKGDNVMVIAGKDRGTTGKVLRALPEKNMVVVEGVNVVKRHRRANQRSRSGQIIDKALPVHVSNVMLVDPKTGKPTRVMISRSKDGSRERTTVKSKAMI